MKSFCFNLEESSGFLTGLTSSLQVPLLDRLGPHCKDREIPPGRLRPEGFDQHGPGLAQRSHSGLRHTKVRTKSHQWMSGRYMELIFNTGTLIDKSYQIKWQFYDLMRKSIHHSVRKDFYQTRGEPWRLHNHSLLNISTYWESCTCSKGYLHIWQLLFS